MFAHHVDNTMEKKLFLKKHNFNNQAYTLCVGLFFCSLSNRVDETIGSIIFSVGGENPLILYKKASLLMLKVSKLFKRRWNLDYK